MNINYKYERNVSMLLAIFFILLGGIIADYGMLPFSAGMCFILAILSGVACLINWMIAVKEDIK